MQESDRDVLKRHDLCMINLWLRSRCQSYIGNVVVSINPFRELPIYNQETIDKYRGRSAFDPKLVPHMYTTHRVIADCSQICAGRHRVQ